MKLSRMKSLFLLLLALSLLAQGAAAAEAKKAKHEQTYRQVTGEVVSVGQDKIAIKSRSKGVMTLAVTRDTDMIGQPVKAGDKATVRYRVDENGSTATRISARAASPKASKKKTAAASAER
jgi:hypothetical protein